MPVALRLFPLAMLLCLLAPGCSREQSETTEAPTPSSHRPSTTLSDPLTEQELQTFFRVLETLPGKQAPEFEPLAQATTDQDHAASKLVEAYRQEFRAMFDAASHGARWRKNDELMATFARHEITPEDFAALMIRMSCAITAGTINSEIDLHQVSVDAQTQISYLVEAISRLDAAPPTQDVVERRREALDSLQNSVAFCEFARILQEVPATSCELVARHRTRLAGHLPQTGNVGDLKQTIQSQIVPASFEQTRPSGPAR